MYSTIIADLEKRVKDLEETVRNLQQECRRLYQIGYSNGVEVARKEYADEFNKLEELGFISCHGFLAKPDEAWLKWIEENSNKFERTNILTKKELYNQMKNKQTDMFEKLGFKIEKGTAVIFSKSPTDEDFIKAQELINNEVKE
jgi:hypothetical protein